MKVFMTRAIQEKFRQSADVFGQGEQYARGLTTVLNLDGPTITIAPPPETEAPDSCGFIVSTVALLEGRVRELRVAADTLDGSAAQIEAPLLNLQARQAVLPGLISEKEEAASGLRTQAATNILLADEKQAQLDGYRNDYPGCFGYYDPETGLSYCPDNIAAAIPQLQTDIPNLRHQAETMNNDAAGLDREVEDLRMELTAVNDAIAHSREPASDQGQDIRERAADLRRQANEGQADIDQYRLDYPQCF